MAAIRELLLAARSLRRKPAFAVVAILTCALAVGACTAIYSVVYSVLLRPLPYPDPNALVAVWQVTKSGSQNQFSDPNFEDLRDQSHAFSAFAQFADGMTTVIAGSEPSRAQIAVVSAQFFDVFRTSPVRGRVFNPDERHEGAPPAAVVSDRYWRRVSNGAAELTTVPLRIGERLYTIVGVMPAQFDFPAGTDVWMPREQEARNPHRTGHNWMAVGRLALNVSLASARTDATTVARRLKTQYGDDTAMSDAALVPLKDELTGSVARSLFVLLAAVGCLLAIACANLANLMLVHVAGKQRELAVRSALGAGRWALARPLLAEASFVAGTGGALGLALGTLGLRALTTLGPSNLPRAGEITISGPVLGFTLATTAVVALGLSFVAAWRAGQKDVVNDLRQGQRGQAGSRTASRIRSALVVAELAASLVLLVGAGLLGRSLALVLSQNPGFRTEGVVTVDLSSSADGTPAAQAALAAMHERAIARLASLPGVVAAGGINRLPMGTSYANGTFLMGPGIEQLADMNELSKLFRDPARTGQAEFRVTSARYFDTMGIPLLRGRVFDDRDTLNAPHVAVISDSLAKLRWRDADPMGVHIQFGNMDGDLRVFTVIGIVGDIRELGLDAKPRPTFYADYRQRPRPTEDFSIVLGTSGATAGLENAIRTAVHEVDPGQAPRIRNIDQIVSASVSDRRFTALVTAAFAASALMLAIVGIYGVLGYAVSQRMPEFGIRLALGGQRSHIWRLVLRHAALLVTTGAAIGLVVAWLSTTAIRSLLYGIEPADPLTFVAVTGILALAALAACAWPALRATRADPVSVLERS